MKRVVKFRKWSVTGCARCGANHTKLRFKQAKNPIIGEDGTTWEWWALCPNTGDPVLLRILEPKAKEEPVEPFIGGWRSVKKAMLDERYTGKPVEKKYVTEEDVKRIIRTYSPLITGRGFYG